MFFQVLRRTSRSDLQVGIDVLICFALYSGFVAILLVRHLNGVDGRSGWRWLYVNFGRIALTGRRLDLVLRFIIDGTITLPIALYGFIIFPDLPATTSAFYLTEQANTLGDNMDMHNSDVSFLGASPILQTVRR